MPTRYIRNLVILFPSAGLVIAVLYAITARSWVPIIHALGTFVLIAGASLLVGGLLGFLFGFPRTSEGTLGQKRYEHNKSLEQIADWLTKMLIGVGLSQMTAVPTALWSFATQLTTGVTTTGAPEGATSIAVCLILYFSVCGFIEGYLATRLLLPAGLSAADKEAQ